MDADILKVQFDSHMSDYNDHKRRVLVEISGIKKTLEHKVSYKNFYWVLGTTFSVMTAILTYIVWQINNIQTISAATGNDVSYLKGKLAPYEVQYKDR